MGPKSQLKDVTTGYHSECDKPEPTRHACKGVCLRKLVPEGVR